jgi:putative membrane protein
MRSCARWIWLPLAAVAVILALAAAPSPSSAASAPAIDVPQPTVAAASNTGAPGGDTDAALEALQPGCGGDDGWDGWWVIGPIFMVLFWGTIIGVVVWAIRQFTRGRGDATTGTALDIAKERYARGEINAEEFDKLRRDLS